MAGAALVGGTIFTTNTTGPAIFSFSLNLGNATQITAVHYSRPGGPVRQCSSFHTTGALKPFSTVTVVCTLGGGVGSNHTMQVVACASSSAGSACFTAFSNFSFAFPLPSFKPNTLRLFGAVNATAVLQLTNTLSQVVSLAGANLVDTYTDISVTYGPTGAETAYTCTVDTRTTASLLVCALQPNAFGQALRFRAVSGGHIFYSADVINYPNDVPSISSVSGCVSAANKATQCPTRGNVFLTITGVFFSPSSIVFVNGVYCSPLRNVNSTHIECLLPSGTGTAQLVVENNGLYSPPVASVVYAAPSVSTQLGCQNGTSTVTIVNCARQGGQLLTILGANFGRAGAAVLIGNTPCNGTQHDAANLHGKLTCYIPPGCAFLFFLFRFVLLPCFVCAFVGLLCFHFSSYFSFLCALQKPAVASRSRGAEQRRAQSGRGLAVLSAVHRGPTRGGEFHVQSVRTRSRFVLCSVRRLFAFSVFIFLPLFSLSRLQARSSTCSRARSVCLAQ